MPRGEWKIAQQVGPKGYFGKVVLEIEGTDTKGVNVNFDSKIDQRWQTGARFGIDYALEHIPKRHLFPKGISVHITSIEGHEVDTSSTLIALVAANALFKAIDFQPAITPKLNYDDGVVSFPK